MKERVNQTYLIILGQYGTRYGPLQKMLCTYHERFHISRYYLANDVQTIFATLDYMLYDVTIFLKQGVIGQETS